MSGEHGRWGKQNDNTRDTPEQRQNGPGQQEGRSTAEWVTLAISVVIVFGMLGLVTYLYFDDGREEAVIEVTPLISETRQVGGRYYVPVEITNTGGQTVEQLLAQVSLMKADGSTEEAQLTVTFLAGGATAEGVAAFSEDPKENQVTVDVVSYLEP